MAGLVGWDSGKRSTRWNGFCLEAKARTVFYVPCSLDIGSDAALKPSRSLFCSKSLFLYRGTSLIMKRTNLGPFLILRVLGGSVLGGWAFSYGRGTLVERSEKR